ncbi:MAG TPA: ABC transporter permease [Candidatus Limnocylindrales bacterium]|jgi:ABC-2 type transport system permease protein
MPELSNAAPARQATLAQLGMELRLTARRGENLFVIVVLPLILLIFFALVPALTPNTPKPIDFLLPGILALAVISTSLVNLSIATAFERSYGVLKRLGGSPLPRAGLVAAKIGAVIVVEVLQVALLTGVAVALFGWAPGAGASIAVVIAAFGLGTLAFGGLGLLMAGTLRAEGTLAAANGLFLVLLLLGGVILPVDHLPGLLADLARVLPASALSDAYRIGLGSASGGALPSLLVLLGWGAIASLLAARSFRWE